MSNRLSTVQRRTKVAVLAMVSLLASVTLLAQVAPRDPSRWEPNIKAFEEQDRRNSSTGEVVFVGASSIVRWERDGVFSELKVLNGGRWIGNGRTTAPLRRAHRPALQASPSSSCIPEERYRAGVSPEAWRRRSNGCGHHSRHDAEDADPGSSASNPNKQPVAVQ